MILPIILFLLYCLIICFWIQNSKIAEKVNLPKSFILGIFIIKLFVGFIYGYIHLNYYDGGDTISLFNESYLLGQSFISQPSYYVELWMGKNPVKPSEVVFTYPSWSIIKKDFGTYFLVHIHALPSLLSFGYYGVHNVFISLIGLIGSLNIYKSLKDKILAPEPLILFVCFLMPSSLFWTSGLHKDVWVYLGISFILLGLSNPKSENNYSVKNILAGLIIITLFRYYLLALIFPVLIAFTLSKLKPAENSFQRYVLTFTTFFILIVIIDIIDNGLMLRHLSDRQHEFLKELGTSKISDAIPWYPSLKGFLFFLPQAMANVLFRPYLWECHDLFQALASIETIFFWFLIILAIVFRRTNSLSDPIILFMLFYAILNFFVIGLLVSNVGTIVRYRAISLTLVTLVFISVIDYSRIKLMLQHKLQNKDKKRI
jgi:hypothetical protein